MSAPKRARARRGSGELLRAEIVAAAKDLLAATRSADDVSIRAIADAVGVTSPSIYLHFDDKDALIEAVVLDVFAELDTAMLSEAAALTEPLERLRAFGLAYVRFALEHPEHYRLAAMDPNVKPPAVDELLASSAFAHFTDAVRDCIDAGVFPAGDPLPIALDLWAAAHGAASLMIAKPYLPWGDAEAYADRVLCAAALGHAVAGLLGPDLDAAGISAWLSAQHGRARH